MILVLGANSFSGSSFVKYLLKKGETVIGSSRSVNPVTALLPHSWCSAEELRRYNFLKADLNLELENIVRLIKKEKIKTIFNFASQGMVAESWLTPIDWYQTNVLSTISLVERLKHLDHLDRYVHVSTPEVYGSTGEGWLSESFDYHPSTPYAISRAAADFHIKALVGKDEFPAVFTRAANVYGEGQALYRIIPKAVIAARRLERLHLHGGGASVRSFIHIEDVCSATLSIGRAGTIGDAYHISTTNTLTISQVVKHVFKSLGATEFLDEWVLNVGERDGKDFAYKLSSNKVRDQFGWRDRISFEEGVDRVIEWFLANESILATTNFKYIHKA